MTLIRIVTFALNSAKKSKCFLRSVARMASMTRKRKRLNSTCSRLIRKLYSGRDMKRFHAEAAWWFSKTERSLYRRAYSRRRGGDRSIQLLIIIIAGDEFKSWQLQAHINILKVICCLSAFYKLNESSASHVVSLMCYSKLMRLAVSVC